MPMSGSVWDTRALKAVVADWYGLLPHQMPMTVWTREEEVERFEAEHSEVFPELWDLVNHPIRQVRMWAKHDWIDIVVWSKRSQSFKLVQDICFKDAYPDETAWRQAILEVVKDPEEAVWVVFHE
jgi:hypothetical protein